LNDYYHTHQCCDDGYNIVAAPLLSPATNVHSRGVVRPSLDILLEEPIQALRSMEAFYSPYEKLQRVLDVFRGVNAALTKISPHTVPSADTILPTMILVVVKAATAVISTTDGASASASATTTTACRKMKMTTKKSNKIKTSQSQSNRNNNSKTTRTSSSSSLQHILRDLYFIENFALPEYLRGEAGYAFTNLYGAIQFLQELDLEVNDNDNDDDDGNDNADDGSNNNSNNRNNNNNGSNNRLSISSDELRRGLQKSRDVAAARNNSRKQNKNITNGGGGMCTSSDSDRLLSTFVLPAPTPTPTTTTTKVSSSSFNNFTSKIQSMRRTKKSKRRQSLTHKNILTNNTCSSSSSSNRTKTKFNNTRKMQR